MFQLLGFLSVDTFMIALIQYLACPTIYGWYSFPIMYQRLHQNIIMQEMKENRKRNSGSL